MRPADAEPDNEAPQGDSDNSGRNRNRLEAGLFQRHGHKPAGVAAPLLFTGDADCPLEELRDGRSCDSSKTRCRSRCRRRESRVRASYRTRSPRRRRSSAQDPAALPCWSEITGESGLESGAWSGVAVDERSACTSFCFSRYGERPLLEKKSVVVVGDAIC